MDKRLRNDWILVVALNIGAFGTAVWKYRNGECAPHVALASGVLASVALTAVLLLTVRVRNRRMGRVTPRSFVIGSLVCSAITVNGLWLTLGNEMTGKDFMMTALSSKPISEIRPEEKALAVQFLRKWLKRNADYEQTLSQMKPLEPPIFSNRSFSSLTIMQQELAGLKKAVELDFTLYAQHEHDLGEFRSAMKERHQADLNSFNSIILSKEESWEEIVSLDGQLLRATIDLYDFAAQNPENIRYVNGNLISHDAGIWNTFAEKRKTCISLVQRLQRLVPKRLFA